MKGLDERDTYNWVNLPRCWELQLDCNYLIAFFNGASDRERTLILATELLCETLSGS
jgi:hypothetical protein